MHNAIVVSPTGDNILAGSGPGRRGTLVSPKTPKAICACAIARKMQRVPCTPRRLRGSGPGPFFAPAFPALLERPVRTVRGEPVQPGNPRAAPSLLRLGVRRDERPPDTRLYPAHLPDLCLDPLHPSRAPSGPLFVCTRGSACPRGPKKAKQLPPPEWGRAGERVLGSAKAAHKTPTQTPLRLLPYRRGLGCLAFRLPYSSRGRHEGEEHARRGAVRTPRVRTRHRGETGKDDSPVDGHPVERARHGRRAPGFRATQGKRERRRALARTV